MRPRFTNAILLSFLLAIGYHSAYPQAAVYKPFEVDSVATPLGGQSMIETFLAVNLQKPFMAQVANVTGKVFITAVVDPNGRVSDVQLMRSLRPDCDQEALRVMRLFNAWKPAMKNGQPVRQLVTYPVTFRANDPITYVDGKRIDFFGKDEKVTIDQQTAVFQQVVSVDSTTGLPTGELILSKRDKPNKWVELVRLPLKRIEKKSTLPGQPDTYMIGHKQDDEKWYQYAYKLDPDGKLLGRERSNGEEITYSPTGLVIFTRNFGGSTTLMHWHANGQLKELSTLDKATPPLSGINPYRLMTAWDSTGRTLIVNGNGQLTHYEQVKSRAEKGQLVQFTETGLYVDGLKDGIWKGTYSDGSYEYEETFAKGKPMGGSALINKADKVTYGASEQNPEFKGGAKEMYAFLGQNITYPVDAMRAGIQGKVFVAFTVCTD
ncbi:MAG: energy transducer TonB, partial [Cytophagaceae bacterium]